MENNEWTPRHGDIDEECTKPRRRNNLTPDDVAAIKQAFDKALAEHACRFPLVTQEQMLMLGEIADTAIEVRDDAKKAAKRIFKWTLFLIAAAGVIGAIVAFVGGLWLKVKFLMNGHG